VWLCCSSKFASTPNPASHPPLTYPAASRLCGGTGHRGETSPRRGEDRVDGGGARAPFPVSYGFSTNRIVVEDLAIGSGTGRESRVPIKARLKLSSPRRLRSSGQGRRSRNACRTRSRATGSRRAQRKWGFFLTPSTEKSNSTGRSGYIPHAGPSRRRRSLTTMTR
jgi:hypothetical protein